MTIDIQVIQKCSLILLQLLPLGPTDGTCHQYPFLLAEGNIQSVATADTREYPLSIIVSVLAYVRLQTGGIGRVVRRGTL